MHKQRPPKHTHSYMDSCAFDPGGTEETCSHRLLALTESGGIHLEIAHSVEKEIDHPHTPPHVKVLARKLVYTRETNLTSEQTRRQTEIREFIQGNAMPGKHEADADHIFDLSERGGGYFITTDLRILSRSSIFFRKYFVTAITPGEYEKLVKHDA